MSDRRSDGAACKLDAPASESAQAIAEFTRWRVELVLGRLRSTVGRGRPTGAIRYQPSDPGAIGDGMRSAGASGAGWSSSGAASAALDFHWSGLWTPGAGGGGTATGVRADRDVASLGDSTTVVESTVVGGADVPYSNNGPSSGVSHTQGTTTFTVPSPGVYEVDYSVTITAGIGSAIAIAVNGTVDASTYQPALNPTGPIVGHALLNLAAGDVLTLRNNSAVPLTLTLAPNVGAVMSIKKLG